MYNRSERNCTYLSKEKIDSNVGPGCYTQPTLYPLLNGKTLGVEGKVPFMTKSKVQGPTKFQVSIPAPGSYYNDILDSSVSTLNVPVFKQQAHSRFPDTVKIAISPDHYNIPSTILGTKLPVIQTLIPHKVYAGVLDKEPIVIGQPRTECVAPGNKLKWINKKTTPSIPYPDHGFVTSAANAAHVICEKDSANLHHAIERASFIDKGFLFPKSAKMLTFQDITDSPGPSCYDSAQAERNLTSRKAENYIGDIHFRGPKTRLIEDCIIENVKDGVPGVGLYDIESKNESAKYTIPKSSREYPPLDLPSPQEYNKQKVWVNGKASDKSLYDCQIDRFLEKFDGKKPDPGAYTANTLFAEVLKNAKERPESSTGSCFNTKVGTPAPGAYHQIKNTDSSERRTDENDTRGFGCSDSRFAKPRTMTPAPSEYHPGTAFITVLDHGKIVKNLSVGIRSQKTKYIKSPGPDRYLVNDVTRDQNFNSMFASVVPRFVDSMERLVPSPNAYKIVSQIHIDSFNITLGKFNEF